MKTLGYSPAASPFCFFVRLWVGFVSTPGAESVSWCMAQQISTGPNPTNIANANPNPPTPADRVVPVHSWRLVIVPCPGVWLSRFQPDPTRPISLTLTQTPLPQLTAWSQFIAGAWSYYRVLVYGSGTGLLHKKSKRGRCR